MLPLDQEVVVFSGNIYGRGLKFLLVNCESFDEPALEPKIILKMLSIVKILVYHY